MGEMKIPQYWQLALTDPKHGYYRHQNVFHKEGDFVTSPEISPLFGQMIAVWMLSFMQNPNVNIVNPYTNVVNKKFRVIELGGGRGLLAKSLIRSFSANQIKENFELCFVEGTIVIIQFHSTIGRLSRHRFYNLFVKTNPFLDLISRMPVNFDKNLSLNKK